MIIWWSCYLGIAKVLLYLSNNWFLWRRAVLLQCHGINTICWSVWWNDTEEKLQQERWWLNHQTYRFRFCNTCMCTKLFNKAVIYGVICIWCCGIVCKGPFPAEIGSVIATVGCTIILLLLLAWIDGGIAIAACGIGAAPLSPTIWFLWYMHWMPHDIGCIRTYNISFCAIDVTAWSIVEVLLLPAWMGCVLGPGDYSFGAPNWCCADYAYATLLLFGRLNGAMGNPCWFCCVNGGLSLLGVPTVIVFMCGVVDKTLILLVVGVDAIGLGDGGD